MQRKVYAFHGRPTLKDVERQLQNGSFRELNANGNVLKCN